MENNKTDISNNSLDIFKTLCAVLIVGIHVSPIVPNEFANTLCVQLIFRSCVPLFFISSGFFFSKMNEEDRNRYLKRILAIYIAGTLLYLPFTISLYRDGVESIWGVIKLLLLGYEHLWYLVALFVSLLSWHIFSKLRLTEFISEKAILITAVIILMIGAFFDEYYHITHDTVITSIGRFIDRFGTTRSAVFMGIPLVLIGRHLRSRQGFFKAFRIRLFCVFILSAAASLGELIFILHNTPASHLPSCDLTFFNWIPATVIFIYAMTNVPFKISKTRSRSLRKLADIVYVIHFYVISLVDALFNDCRYMPRYAIVVMLSYFFAFICLTLIRIIRPNKQEP